MAFVKALVVNLNTGKNSVVKFFLLLFLFETEGRTFILTQEMRNPLRKGTLRM